MTERKNITTSASTTNGTTYNAGNWGKPGTDVYALAVVLTDEYQTPEQLRAKAGLSTLSWSPLKRLAKRGIADKAENPRRFKRGPNYLAFCRQRGISVGSGEKESVPTTTETVSPPTPMILSPQKQEAPPQTIRIDPEVWRALQKHAVPFVETPNDVLRRLLGLEPK